MRLLALLFSITLVFGFLSGCTEPVAESLSEADAIKLSTLLEKHGVAASVERYRDRWRVLVPASSLPDAREIAAAHHLPEAEPTGLVKASAFPVISGIAHHDMMQRNLEARLGQSMERLAGVYDARVHLDLPRTDWARQEGSLAQASVVLLHDSDISPVELGEDARALLLGAVTELKRDRVTLILQTPNLPADGRLNSAQVGPWQVAPESQATLQWALGAGLGVVVLLSGLSAWLLLRRRKPR